MDLELVARFEDGERRWLLREGTCSIGRSPASDVVINRDTVTFHHACIHRRGDCIEIEDLKSTNGTLVDGVPIAGRHRIHPGDDVQLGGVRLTLRQAGARTLAGTPSARVMPWELLHSLTPPPQKVSRLLDTLVDLGSFLVGRHSRETIYSTVLLRMADLIDYQLGCLFLWNGWELHQVSQQCRGALDRELAFSHTVLEGAARNRTPLFVADPANPSESMLREHINSALAVPLLDDTHVIGVLYLDTRLPKPPIDAEDVRLVVLLATPLALKIASCEIADELERARCVQQALLAHMPRALPGYELHAQFEACAAVGGDLYDFLALPDGRFGIVFGDVVGDGVSAALQMAALLATIRSTATQAATPLELANGLRQRACGCLNEQSFVTLFVGYLEPQTGHLDYVNAGQEGVGVLHADGRWQILPTTTTPIGMPLFGEGEIASIEVPPGALLAAWSDGFPEAHRARGSEMLWFETAQVLSTLGALQHAPLPEAAAVLFERVRDFEAGTPAADDRTLLLLRRGVE